ncbi:PEP-CTERM sorting domain-containing protein [Hahella sp. SMD15-11]|uniref:PEP-CTERM sorting domain-containing protein n=1 Tax=Thermohahella caldifontis TaxID=3142973 RepID=A0AB39UWT6_9GAMM
MKKLCTAITLTCAALSAQAYTITDAYVGSDDHGYGDVIGATSKFDISRLTYSLSGTTLRTRIYTNFVNHIGVFPDADSEGLKRGIGLGDLLLSDQWSPYGLASNGFAADNAQNGTHWIYGLALDDRWNTSGSVTLYKLAGPNRFTLLESDDFMSSGWTFRNGQAVAVDTQSSYALNTGKTGTFQVNAAGGYIQFDMDLSGTALLDGPEIAFHWAMTGGNDVIEGKGPVPVSEPASLTLAGLGLLLAGLRRRRPV